jgi:hypothetical protein
MSTAPERHFVIAIYGVGNPAPGDVQRSLASTLNAVAPGVPLEVREFDWNAIAVHAPRASGRLWRYSELFSGSFASAAWFRTLCPTRIERVRTGIDAVAHGAWAVTQSLVVILTITATFLFLLGATSSALSPWVGPMVALGVVPPGVGWRASALSGYAFELAVLLLRYGVLLTAVCLAASMLLAFLEALFSWSTTPIAVTARRHALILLLVPCTLLSLTFANEASAPAFDKEGLVGLSGFAMVALIFVGFMSVVFGGFRSTLTWVMLPFAVLLAVAAAGNLVRLIRGRVAGVWLGPAKVLLDIALYVGTPSYRSSIQEHLTQIVAGIPNRSTTAIWIVAHSLGSVIALDNLTNSTAWQPTDHVRLVTLGSPIRRFFFRFFPGAFFAPRLGLVVSTIASRIGEFTWLNAFRRFDYVGTSLGLTGHGCDLPTRQNWPAHANYWSDGKVARTVLDGLLSARPGTITRSICTAAAASTPGVPVGLRKAFATTAPVCGSVLVAVAAAAAGWMLLPGLREVIVRPSFELRAPVSTTARVRHERGFVSNSRLHEFRFDFRDQLGRDRRESASVVGFFGVWSDPRFDYLALARFVRASCTPERAQRFLEFGWSVPCSRDDISIVYDRDNPARFRVVGFEFKPGYLARGMRAFVTALVNLTMILLALAVVALVAVSWARLWAIFAGDPEMIRHLLGRGDATERPSGEPA